MLAGAVLLVQRKNRRLNQRRSLPHGYFELRLAEECQRAESCTPVGQFSVARLDIEGDLTSEEFAEVAAEHLRPTDILGTYERNAYEVLLLGANELTMDAVVVDRELGGRGSS